MRRIENIRSELCSWNEVVEAPDYGAGSPTEERSILAISDGPDVALETIGLACKNYSKSHAWAGLLFELIRHRQPEICFELGTCLGISACYQAAALDLNDKGTLVSFEGAPSFAAIAVKNFALLGLADRAEVVVGRFSDRLDARLQRIKQLDFAFIDGHHDGLATLKYFELLLEKISSEGILVFDDIDWSPSMAKSWEEIACNPRVNVSIDLGKMGICLIDIGMADRFRLAVNG